MVIRTPILRPIEGRHKKSLEVFQSVGEGCVEGSNISFSDGWLISLRVNEKKPR